MITGGLGIIFGGIGTVAWAAKAAWEVTPGACVLLMAVLAVHPLIAACKGGTELLSAAWTVWGPYGRRYRKARR